MSETPFDRGAVVWHPAPFKQPSGERPFLVLSDDSHPFYGTEYAAVGLTRTARPRAIELDSAAWALGDPGEGSYVSPWYVFTLKHADVLRPKGALTTAATDRVANAVAALLGARDHEFPD